MQLLNVFFSNPIIGLFLITTFVMSLTIHEFFHAFVADKLGDPTSRMKGRLTLNPLAHLDPLGTLALLLAGFGWAKPVPVDTYNLDNPRRDMALIALAGPASNFVIAIIFALVYRFMGAENSLMGVMAAYVVGTNLVLGIFNFVPVAPLDGSKIILLFLPNQLAYEFEDFMHRYGFILLLGLIFPWFGGVSPISMLIGPVISFAQNLLLR